MKRASYTAEPYFIYAYCGNRKHSVKVPIFHYVVLRYLRNRFVMKLKLSV